MVLRNMDIYQTAWRHIPGDLDNFTHLRRKF